jgi:hypothetical protein
MDIGGQAGRVTFMIRDRGSNFTSALPPPARRLAREKDISRMDV